MPPAAVARALPKLHPDWSSHGFFVVPEVISPSLVAAAQREISNAIARSARAAHADDRTYKVEYETGVDSSAMPVHVRELAVRKLMDISEALPFFWELAREHRVLASIQAALGPGVRLLQSMAMIKPPGIGSAKDWHQDAPYFRIDPVSEACGIWIALDDVDLENGCMQVVAGSHRDGIAEHVQGPTGWRLPESRTAELSRAAHPVCLRAGSALVFHSCLFHYTAPNTSARKRRAVQLHYVSSSTRSLDEGRPTHSLDSPCPPWRG